MFKLLNGRNKLVKLEAPEGIFQKTLGRCTLSNSTDDKKHKTEVELFKPSFKTCFLNISFHSMLVFDQGYKGGVSVCV